MAGTSKLEAERDRLQANLGRIDDNLAALIVEKEALGESIADKRERKEEANPKRQVELRESISSLLATRKDVKARIHELRPRREKVARKLKRTARKLRNLASPKVVDLAFDRTAVRGLTPMGPVYGSVGHYTAGPLDDDGDDEAFELWRRYDAAHKAQGWTALGYNIGVTRDGTIVRLRGIEYVGAHTLGFNSGRVGISVHGTTGDTPTSAQRRALQVALKKYGLQDKPVIGHWQAPGQSTACPGSFLEMYVSKGKRG